ncbi:unnamed protein product [Rangifer tarandus platyrhynchus]|uniref:Secreted protein n=1 Tax=Rangifer tarandus platyrhynchus TaxID=3082113 RepID=A0ABN8ZQG4_RANTA|nr:unnamed protein product [Rangifer tarandus platyrhynchus]
MGALAFSSITRVLTAGALPLALCAAWISSFQTVALTLESVLPFCRFPVSVSRRLFVDPQVGWMLMGRYSGGLTLTPGCHVSVLKFTESGHNPSAHRRMMEKQNAVCVRCSPKCGVLEVLAHPGAHMSLSLKLTKTNVRFQAVF